MINLPMDMISYIFGYCNLSEILLCCSISKSFLSFQSKYISEKEIRKWIFDRRTEKEMFFLQNISQLYFIQPTSFIQLYCYLDDLFHHRDFSKILNTNPDSIFQYYKKSSNWTSYHYTFYIQCKEDIYCHYQSILSSVMKIYGFKHKFIPNIKNNGYP